VWDRLVAEVDAMGLLYAADGDLLAQLATAVARYGEAERVLQAEGLVVADREHPGRVKRNTWVFVQREAAEMTQRLSDRFALSPAARARLAAGGRRDEPGEGERLLS